MMATETNYSEIEVNEITVLQSEQIETGGTNDNPFTALQIELPSGERGWVAGPHGVDDCAISDWLRYVGKPAETMQEAIKRGVQ